MESFKIFKECGKYIALKYKDLNIFKNNNFSN